MAIQWGWASRSARRARRLRRWGHIERLESRRLLALVSIVAEDPNASESGPDLGLFRVSMTEFRSTPTQVNYQIDVSPRPMQSVERELLQLLEGSTGVRVRRIGSWRPARMPG